MFTILSEIDRKTSHIRFFNAFFQELGRNEVWDVWDKSLKNAL